MSEFCEHIEWNVIGFREPTYEQSKALHRRGCPLCEAGANDTTIGPPVRFKCRDCGRTRPLGHTLCWCKTHRDSPSSYEQAQAQRGLVERILDWWNGHS